MYLIDGIEYLEQIRDLDRLGFLCGIDVAPVQMR